MQAPVINRVLSFSSHPPVPNSPLELEEEPSAGVAQRTSPRKRPTAVATSAAVDKKKKPAPSTATLRVAAGKKKAVQNTASLRTNAKKKKAPPGKKTVKSAPETKQKDKSKRQVKKKKEESAQSDTESMVTRSRNTKLNREKPVVTGKTIVTRKTRNSKTANLDTSESEETGGESID